MRPLSFLPHAARAGLALALLLAAPPVRAQGSRAQGESPPPSAAPTVPVPPPSPPARPDELRTAFPAGDTPPSPILDAPAPPARPPELSATPPASPQAQDARPQSPPETSPPKGSDAVVPPPGAPLPPARPDELRTLFPAGDTPPNPMLDVPSPPGRPPELSAPAQTPVQAAPSSPEGTSPLPEAPLPPPRPEDLRTQFPAGGVPPSPILDAPAPPERPAELAEPPALPPDAPIPPVRPPELSGDSVLKLTIGPPEDAACLKRLNELGVSFTKQPPIVNGQCSVAHPLSVSALGNGVGLHPGGTMVCRITEALARWSAEVRHIAETELGDSLKGLTSAGAYVCRGQNHDTEAQLSDHAFANAIDIAGFTFAKRAPISVGTLPAGTKEAAFLAAVRAKACGFFTTVLGPGTNEAHATHFHLDTRERRNGYRLCE